MCDNSGCKLIGSEYVDVTDVLLENAKPNYSNIKELFEYQKYNTSNAKFDKKDITILERDASRIIQSKIGGTIELIHRVQVDGVPTPDTKYFNKELFNKEIYFDIKSPKKSKNLKSKSQKISRQFNEAKHQTNNIIISLLREDCDLSNTEAIKQIEECLNNYRYIWIEIVILVGKDELIKIYKKRRDLNEKSLCPLLMD